MISVVMSVYNGGEFLPAAIESILNQTYKDFEFVIVNDGSKDGSLEVIKQYQAKDNRINLIDLGENKGFCYALNRGIEEAKYPWIARMDADDISLPERFEKQLAMVEQNPDLVVVGSYISHINSKNEVLSVNVVGPATREEMESRIKKGHPIYVMHPTALMKKEIVQKVGGYDPDFFSAEDIELFARMIKHGAILAIPEPLLLYRIHGGSISMNKMAKQKTLTEYVELMYHCDNTGEKLPTLKEFLDAQQNQPFLKKARKQMTIWRSLYYRRAGMAYGDKKWAKAIMFFGISSLIDPAYSIPRAWRQVFSSRKNRAKPNPTT